MKKLSPFWTYFILAVAVYALIQILIMTGFVDIRYQNLLITICINIMLAVSLHVIIGITGQFSIGHAGFLAVGAYISAIFTMKLGMPFLVAIIAGAVVAAVAGLI